MDRGSWQALVHGVTKSQTWLSEYTSPPQFSSVQSLSHVRLFATPWIAACQASLSITNSRSLLKPMSIESVMPPSHLILCHPLLLLPLIPPSIRVFSNESTLRMRWPKYWSFSFSISPSNEHPGLISFRMDWFDLLAVQGTLKSLLQHHSSKASIFQSSAFFTTPPTTIYIGNLLLNIYRKDGHYDLIVVFICIFLCIYNSCFIYITLLLLYTYHYLIALAHKDLV